MAAGPALKGSIDDGGVALIREVIASTNWSAPPSCRKCPTPFIVTCSTPGNFVPGQCSFQIASPPAMTVSSSLKASNTGFVNFWNTPQAAALFSASAIAGRFVGSVEGVETSSGNILAPAL